ncbi:MAG: hypothetical protein Q8O23_00470 [Gallionella sp.]|nr:hypothetical protein [Gallionella sp.]
MHDLSIKYSVGNNHGAAQESNELVITNYVPGVSVVIGLDAANRAEETL